MTTIKNIQARPFFLPLLRRAGLLAWTMASVPPALAEEGVVPVYGSVVVVGQNIASDAQAANDAEGDALTYTMEIILKDSFEGTFYFVHVRGSEGFEVYDGVNDVTMGMDMAAAEVSAAFLSHTFWEVFTVTLGKIDPTGFFDGNAFANDSNSQFLSSALTNNAAILFPGHEFGYMFALQPVNWLSWQVGVFEDVDAQVTGELQEKFVIGEFGIYYTPSLGNGNLRLSAWNSQSADRSGFAISLDQAFGDHFGLFSRFGSIGEGRGDDTAAAFSFGGQINIDAFTLGLGYANEIPAGKSFETESRFESYLKWQMNRRTALTGDLQFVTNPGFDADEDTVAVLGFRATVTY